MFLSIESQLNAITDNTAVIFESLELSQGAVERISDKGHSIDDLDGKTLGIINDPGAFQLLEDLGVRWGANADKPGGKVRLANLIAYSDQSRNPHRVIDY